MKRSSTLLVVALLMATASPALAAPPPADAEDRALEDRALDVRARALFDEGIQAFDAGRFAAAREALEKSFELRRSYDTAGLLGQVELELGDFPSAAEHIEYCLRYFPTGENRELHADIQAAFAAAKEHVGAVLVSVDTAGVELYLDGEAVGVSPLDHPLFVSPGTHSLRGVSSGAESQQTFEVRAGEERAVKLTFHEEPSADAGNPSASGSSELAPPRSFGSDSRPSWTPAYVLGGIAAVGFVTSIVFRASRANDHQTVERLRGDLEPGACAPGTTQPTACSALRDARDSYDDKGAAADISLVVGAAAATATLGYVGYLLFDRPEPTSGLRAAAGFDGNGGNIVVSGSF